MSASAGTASGHVPGGPAEAPASHALGCSPVWPLSSQIEMASLASSVTVGRHHARDVLDAWGLADLTGDAAIIVSELLTNAITASADTGTPVRLRLLAHDGQLIIEAWDQSPRVPRPCPASADDENGRGLTVIAAIAVRWGICRSGIWKAVWAELLTVHSAPP